MGKARTILAADIDLENACIRYDQSVKKVIANIPVLARILKYTVEEVYDFPIDKIEACIGKDSIEISKVQVKPGMTNRKIVGENPQDFVKDEGVVFFDIRFSLYLPGGECRKVIINIEAQRKSNPGYSLVSRGIFYVARLISAQLGVEFFNNKEDSTQYDGIKKVYSIWICMDCPADKRDSIISYSLSPKVLYSGNPKLNIDYNYDLINVTLVHLNKSPGKSSHELIRMMDILLSSMEACEKKRVLDVEHGLQMSVQMEQEVAGMCNLSAGVLEEGIMLGEARGMALGETQGINLINDLYAYLLSKGMTDDMNKAIRDKEYCNFLLNKYRSLLV
ncbi:MAG: Rpn family recombination-promoting nuclease/putative transposase [Selenomonadaceae bacterium]|nr:Rpn family recombination-promoting nuclease/putative transposase [Selenomonadaceae bacterium]